MGEVPGTAAAPRAPGKLLTVGIPVFNGRSLLRSCLESVVSSTLPRERYEVVVADDGSSEPETLAILAEFDAKLSSDPGFFRVLSLGSNSGGAARPRNRILDAATGEYVFFVDSDDTIGDAALERIVTAVARTPADWVALNQVPVNGRGALCRVRAPHTEVPRSRALSTLTVHKVFRRTEIERQQLRFDENLPSGQDLTFAFSFLVNANRFLMLGDYDYYFLTRHADNPNEPPHLSRRAKTPPARIDKSERILRSMLDTLRQSTLSDAERRRILLDVCLPRVLVQSGYLAAIVNAGPAAGARALCRLSELLADPMVAGLDPAELKGVTPEHLTAIAAADWPRLARLLRPAGPGPETHRGLAARWAGRGRHLIDVASGRARHRRVITELSVIRRSVQDLRQAQSRLEANLRAEIQRQGHSTAVEPGRSVGPAGGG